MMQCFLLTHHTRVLITDGGQLDMGRGHKRWKVIIDRLAPEAHHTSPQCCTAVSDTARGAPPRFDIWTDDARHRCCTERASDRFTWSHSIPQLIVVQTAPAYRSRRSSLTHAAVLEEGKLRGR